ncbi:MAG TPA: beta-galactosidase [Tepidisphaeraceae bacterium]|jgi:hypothetical protein|nr:beta-galactosidase [Tepidisphaeraceae bacterium]
MKTLALLTVALVASFSVVAQDSRPAGENEFALGIWYEGGVGAARQNTIPEDPAEAAPLYDRTFKDIAAHNIKIVVVPNSPPNHHKLVLDTAQKHGLKVIIETGLDGGELGAMIRGSQPIDKAVVQKVFDGIIKPIVHHPALQRIQLLDEPELKAYGRYKEVADQLKPLMPDVPVFCCLASAQKTAEFLKETGEKVVAFDAYTIRVDTPKGDIKAMEEYAWHARKSALDAKKAGAESWAVIQCHSITNVHRYPTPSEIRCEAYLSLATGNRGVFWFLYQSQFFDKEHKNAMRGLVNEKYKADARWADVAKVAAEIQKLAPTLMDLEPSNDEPIKDDDVRIYRLTDSKGTPYLFAVNLNTLKTQQAHLQFDGSAGKPVVKVLAVPSNSEIPADTEGNAKWEDAIAPGSGSLFRVETKN